MAEYVALHSPACSAVWELAPGEAPLWRYWGPRLPEGALPPCALREERPEPSFSLHFDQPLSVLPGSGMGWFGKAAVRAHRSGADWTLAISDCALERPSPERVVFVLRDAAARIEARLSAHLCPATDTLTLHTTLTNAGDGVLDVEWLAAGVVPLPPDAREVLSFGGRHNAEFVELRDPLTRSTWSRENRRGLTSHDCFPGALVVCADGTAYGAQLAWSGNHAQTIEWIDDARWQWQAGEALAPGEIRLGAGESLSSPEWLLSVSAEGLDGVSQAFHRAIRARLCWPGGQMAPRPVHLNTWEGFYFDHDEAALKDLASAAAQLGIERFVLDDGWFGKRDDDTSSLGDWVVDRAKYPAGLAPLAAHVNAQGMEFGLWFEPEMISPDSDLYRAHPDWALHTPGRDRLAARHQLVLNMAREDVREYLFEAIAALLGALPITYLKWDHNRDLTHAGERALYHAQTTGAYALMARLRAAFPEVEIEACAGGGGRIDAGVVAHTHRFWTSDCIDAVSRIAMQRGFLRFMPPELMGSHVGANPAHSTGRGQSMAFRAGVALPGHLGVELDVRKLGAAESAELADTIARYKALRARLHSGQLWQGDCGDHVVWQAHGSPESLILLVTRHAPTSQRHPPHLRLPMLDAARRYRISGAHSTEIAGAWAQRMGLALPPMRGEEVLVYEVCAL